MKFKVESSELRVASQGTGPLPSRRSGAEAARSESTPYQCGEGTARSESTPYQRREGTARSESTPYQRGKGPSRQTKTDVRLARCAEVLADCHQACGHQAGAVEGGPGLEEFVTRRGLAGVLKVSVRTVDEMVAAKEITPVRIRGLVRFYLPDVVRELTAAAVARLEKLKENSGGAQGTARPTSGRQA